MIESARCSEDLVQAVDCCLAVLVELVRSAICEKIKSKYYDPKRCIQDPSEVMYNKPFRVSCHVVGSLGAAREIELGIIRCAVRLWEDIGFGFCEEACPRRVLHPNYAMEGVNLAPMKEEKQLTYHSRADHISLV
jgi:hypothetical protein